MLRNVLEEPTTTFLMSGWWVVGGGWWLVVVVGLESFLCEPQFCYVGPMLPVKDGSRNLGLNLCPNFVSNFIVN